MPIYDYKCRACGHAFEALTRVSEAPACRSCASPDVERQISGFAFSVRSGGLSKAARRSVEKQQKGAQRDRIEYEREIEQKHLDD